ncbi:MAG: hypothetical protein ACK2UJ_20600 [Candidatus Promineifilaceae bacterium]
MPGMPYRQQALIWRSRHDFRKAYMPGTFYLLSILFVFTILLNGCSSPDNEELLNTTADFPPEPSAAPPGPTEAVTEAIEEVTPAGTVDPAAYPAATAEIPQTPSPASYPQAYDIPAGAATAAGTTSADADISVFLPIMGGSSITPTTEPTQTPEPEPTVDFAAVQADLEAQGQEIGFIKTGFHVTLPEDRKVLDDWMTRLDAAGVPFFLKSVDNAEPLFKAQELMRKSGVAHVLVYRSTGSVPHYELPPEQAAQHHWTIHRDLFPPELDPNLVWIETLNEPDRTQSEWLAQFALETAKLAMADGYRWAAFGWASGEPEPGHWRGPFMQEFLRLAAENPERLAIALHEYSYTEDDISHEYPYKIGRFQELFQITDEMGIARPTVLVTEWGWEHADIPPVDQAIKDIKWASKLYAAYPQVKGAAIWNIGIGCCFGDISEQVQEIVEPLTELSLRKYYAVPAETQPVNPAAFQP